MDAPQQREFAFSREEKLMLLAAADFSQLGLSPVLSRRARAVLEHLELVSGSKGCFPSIELLAGRIGVTTRAVRKWLVRFTELRLITITPRIVPGYGQIENLYAIAWETIRNLVPAADLARIDHTLGRRRPSAAQGQKSSGGLKKVQGPPGTQFRGPPELCSPRPIDGREVKPPPEVQEVLREEAFRAGVDQAAAAVQAALAAGCSADEIQAAIAHRYERNDLRSPAAALYVKLTNMRPGDDPARGWPKLDAKKAHAEAQRRRDWADIQRTTIIKAGRRAGKPDDQITSELAAAGLGWE